MGEEVSICEMRPHCVDTDTTLEDLPLLLKRTHVLQEMIAMRQTMIAEGRTNDESRITVLPFPNPGVVLWHLSPEGERYILASWNVRFDPDEPIRRDYVYVPEEEEAEPVRKVPKPYFWNTRFDSKARAERAAKRLEAARKEEETW